MDSTPRGKRFLFRSPVRLWELTVLALCAILIAGVSAQRAPISSAETRFVERSESGMQIVPASCPSNPHYSGDCSNGVDSHNGGYACVPTSVCSGYDIVNSCTGALIESCSWSCAGGGPRYICSGNHIYYQGTPCASTYVSTCTFPQSMGCSNGACLPPPPPEFVPWDYTWDGETQSSDGGLTAHPRLLRMGQTSTVFWNTRYVTECTVTEDNPDISDSWTGESSGASGKGTSGITQKTTYTLRCTGLDGSILTDSETINVIPVWQEQ